MNRITDPEVLADLARRNASERERPGDRKAVGANGKAWAPPVFVDHWPCRGGCSTMIGVTRDDVEIFQAMNRKLVATRQEPVPKSKVMWCPDCKRRDDELAQMERETKRRPAEQQSMQLGDTNTSKAHEPSSGMRAPRRSKR